MDPIVIQLTEKDIKEFEDKITFIYKNRAMVWFVSKTISDPLSFLNEHITEIDKIYNDLFVYRSDKIQVAPDFIVQSPKIKDKREDAYKEAKEEVLKDEKSIAKLALTLPKLIEHIEELEERIAKLEK